jgi:hypothetical protein
MSSDLDEILDDLFHGCAWAAFAELVAATGCIPDTETTRRLAYRYYEEASAEKNKAQTTSVESG